ncbi:RNA polymerase sigma factor [Reichenbachiella agarivorans]|uniref:RNA polymerase sigma factor n=1 Tax=Reichenbachiella agarivorans TaxID=2979464 RepID=A0ABY6CTV2_9BACT|nr:RNA polymerase sigma factor [Reichenbachiella agarivorans]UXP33954.1 RNA polymerase sigma factor [Reichenbachiella agarivorans]
MEDTLLIDQLVQQNTAAFKVLFDTYAKMVYNTCLNFLQVQEDAEEVTQDVFMEINAQIHHFEGKSSLKTWIYRIACNKSLEHLRKAKRKKRFAFFVSVDDHEVQGDLLIDHPGIEAENLDKATLIQKELHGLAENQRTAFTLYHMEGLTYKEISEIMDLSLSSVESLMFRAKTNLKKKLSTLNLISS